MTEVIFTFISWPLGGLAALQVEREFMGQGLGTLAVKAISQKIAEMGYDIRAGVKEGNAPSQALFEKLGFTKASTFYMLATLPLGTN